MAPRVEAFHPSRLEDHIRFQPNGKHQKEPINLKDCKLKELLQYECDLSGPREDAASKVICRPILRLFRQCANGMTIETTYWEDVYDGKDKTKSDET